MGRRLYGCCPACGGADHSVRPRRLLLGDTDYVIACPGCGFETDHWPSIKEARDAWNSCGGVRPAQSKLPEFFPAAAASRVQSVSAMAKRLEELEEVAGANGWGGEYREDMFEELLAWLQEPRKRRTLSGLLTYLLTTSSAKTAASQQEH